MGLEFPRGFPRLLLLRIVLQRRRYDLRRLRVQLRVGCAILAADEWGHPRSIRRCVALARHWSGTHACHRVVDGQKQMLSLLVLILLQLHLLLFERTVVIGRRRSRASRNANRHVTQENGAVPIGL